MKARKKEKNEERDKKGTRIGHMDERKRRPNFAKCCRVYFQEAIQLLSLDHVLGYFGFCLGSGRF